MAKHAADFDAYIAAALLEPREFARVARGARGLAEFNPGLPADAALLMPTTDAAAAALLVCALVVAGGDKAQRAPWEAVATNHLCALPIRALVGEMPDELLAELARRSFNRYTAGDLVCNTLLGRPPEFPREIRDAAAAVIGGRTPACLSVAPSAESVAAARALLDLSFTEFVGAGDGGLVLALTSFPSPQAYLAALDAFLARLATGSHGRKFAAALADAPHKLHAPEVLFVAAIECNQRELAFRQAAAHRAHVGRAFGARGALAELADTRQTRIARVPGSGQLTIAFADVDKDVTK